MAYRRPHFSSFVLKLPPDKAQYAFIRQQDEKYCVLRFNKHTFVWIWSVEILNSLNVQFNHAQYSDEILAASVCALLDNNIILAMATVQVGDSYINSAHFAYNERLELIIFTHPYAEHSQNLLLNTSVAVAVWNTPPVWGLYLQGLQMFGHAAPVPTESLPQAITVYRQRFPAFGNVIHAAEDFERNITTMRLYAIQVERIKLIDELRFGKRNWITAAITNPPSGSLLPERLSQFYN